MSKPVFKCPNCNNSSTFTVESEINQHPSNYVENFKHLIIRCDVCEEITYQKIKLLQIDQGRYSPPKIFKEEVFMYPFGYLPLEQDLPENIKNYLVEANNCFKSGSLKASASMCRATISAICDDKKSDGKNFKERIDNLPLSSRLKEIAKNIKWIGDKTLHNDVDWAQANWNRDTIEEILAFISRIIDDLYTQERKAKELNTSVSKAGQGKKK